MKAHYIQTLAMSLTLVAAAHANILTVPGTDYFVNIANPNNISGVTATSGIDYYYNIGKTEITHNQWSSFTSAVGTQNLYGGNPLLNSSGTGAYGGPYTWGGNKPAVQLSWHEAAQFCNWLTSGSTTDGAYQFNGVGGAYSGMSRSLAMQSHSSVYVIPSYDEWIMAAFYNGTDITKYANGTSTAPTGWTDAYTGPLPEANINATPDYPFESSTPNPALAYPPWEVGSGAEEQNGTYDMMGNVWEWTEEADLVGGSAHHANHIDSDPTDGHGPAFPHTWDPANESSWLGFRVVEIGNSVIPEPASIAMMAVIGLGAFTIKRWFSI